jgi:hypothetical protein
MVARTPPAVQDVSNLPDLAENEPARAAERTSTERHHRPEAITVENQLRLTATCDESNAEVATSGHDEDQTDSAKLRGALAEMAQLPLTTLGLDEILTHIAELAVVAIPGADGASLTLLVHGSAGAHAQGHTVRSDPQRAHEHWPTFGAHADRWDTLSAFTLVLPLSNSSVRATGSMTLYSDLEDSLDKHSRETAEIFAVPAAMTLRDALLLAQNLRTIEQLKTSMANRAIIDQAIGIVMSRTGGNPETAFAKLRALSQKNNKKLADLAHGLVEEATRRARFRAPLS